MALYPEGADGFVRVTLPEIEGALAAGEPVLVLADLRGSRACGKRSAMTPRGSDSPTRASSRATPRA